MSLSHPKYRSDIDGLRAIAVLSVLVFHGFPDLMPGGFVGVDVFFVISGFLISTILFDNLDKKTFSFGVFYARRMKRIFPALLLVLAACYLTGWIFLLPVEFKALGKNIAASAGFVSNFVFWRESGYFDTAADTKPLLHMWSLGVEEQFYIVWPIILWAAHRARIKLIYIVFAAVAISFALNIYTVKSNQVAAFYSPQTRFWELLAGNLLAWLLLYQKERFAHVSNGLKNWISICGASLIVIAIATTSSASVFPGWWALLPVCGSVLLIFSGTQAWASRAILSHRLLVWIGLISFPLYLWHWPLLSFARIIEGENPSESVRVALLALSFLLAWGTYRWIEIPVRTGKIGKTATIPLAVAMLAVGYVGYNTFQRNGLDFRFSEEVRELARTTDYNWYYEARADKCQLNGDQFLHDASCVEVRRPLIGLWGDSHASSLYPGLRKLQDRDNFGIAQLTQAGCGPIFDLPILLYKKNCNEINKGNLAKFVENPPDILLLHGSWINGVYPLTIDELTEKVEKTIKEIKHQLPSTKIVIVGPVPRWKDSPQKTSIVYWRKHPDKSAAVPSRLQAERLDDVDNILMNIAKRQNAGYVSLLRELCNEAGCIARVGDRPEDFIMIDSNHFSKAGSEYLLDRIQGQIFN